MTACGSNQKKDLQRCKTGEERPRQNSDTPCSCGLQLPSQQKPVSCRRPYLHPTPCTGEFVTAVWLRLPSLNKREKRMLQTELLVRRVDGTEVMSDKHIAVRA